MTVLNHLLDIADAVMDTEGQSVIHNEDTLDDVFFEEEQKEFLNRISSEFDISLEGITSDSTFEDIAKFILRNK